MIVWEKQVTTAVNTVLKNKRSNVTRALRMVHRGKRTQNDVWYWCDTSSPSFPLSWFYCNLFIAAQAMIPPPKPPSYGTCPQKGACIIIVASTRAGGSSIGCSSRL